MFLDMETPVRTSQETRNVFSTEPSRLMLCKILSVLSPFPKGCFSVVLWIAGDGDSPETKMPCMFFERGLSCQNAHWIWLSQGSRRGIFLITFTSFYIFVELRPALAVVIVYVDLKTALVHLSWLIASVLIAVSVLGSNALIFACYMIFSLLPLNVSLPYCSIRGRNLFPAFYAEQNFRFLDGEYLKIM
jgi:hypothetical protein